MKRRILKVLLALLIVLWVIVPLANAEKVDMSQLTCSDLLKIEDEDEAANLIVWLDGYLSGLTGDPKIDENALEQFVEELIKFAQKNPDVKLLKAAEMVGTE
ncbi:MAG: hypothetical protein HQK76_14690 [Desulfobacterales bacterium]|nr:hypothetical protein [Desulfobacterales bacterium]